MVLGCEPRAPETVPGPIDQRRHNVLVLSIDTLQRSALRAFDARARPLANLDSFAQNAARLLWAHSTAPWTLPAHASLLTGLYPDRHGATHPKHRVRPDVMTLAQVLRGEGYQTVAFTDGGYVHRSFGLAAGFDRYDMWTEKPEAGSLTLPRKGRFHRKPGVALFDRAIAFLEQRSATSPPFFLFLHTFSVHNYFEAHSWATAALPKAELADSTYYMQLLDGRRTGSDADWQALESLYAGELRHLDRGLGRLLAALDAAGLGEDTMIFVTSDHGEGFDVGAGRLHHAGRLHEDLIRVPLLVAGPGIVPQAIEHPVSLVDVMPTILDLLQVAIPETLDGRSFGSVLRGGESPGPRAVYAMEHRHYWQNGKRFSVPEVQTQPISLAVIGDNQWYIEGPNEVREAYDMTADPGQEDNLAGELDRFQDLQRLAAERRQIRPFSYERPADQVLEEQLRSLGYVR
jgi:arylsulfatase A-like enzyme